MDLDLPPPYSGYLYSYPHKTAYGPLPDRPLRELWQTEDRSALFAYVHVPFCEMRCGFCNLFTASRPPAALIDATLGALERQAEQVSEAIAPAGISRFAVGGGTPTLLELSDLQRVLDVLAGLGARGVPGSVECSPGTVTADKLALLKERGVTRMSMGVQSFVDDEVSSLLRPQRSSAVEAALTLLRDADFATLNLDLIYGIDGQTPDSWQRSIRRALEWEPDEIFLYPLYVRPLTGLNRKGAPDDDARLALYREGRRVLLEAGYTQFSMRCFRKGSEAPGPRYTCQEDGMVGLGAGARSYTRTTHWATRFAVAPKVVRSIIEDYADATDFRHARWGIELDEAEQRRRYLLLSLLNVGGLDVDRWVETRGSEPTLIQQLARLVAAGFAERDGSVVRLTETGLEQSDAIGPWLVSPDVRQRMEAWEVR